MIWNEVMISIKKNRILTIALIIQFSISYLIGNFLFVIVNNMNQTAGKYQSHLSDKHTYDISDNLESNELRYFMQNPDALNRLKLFHHELVHGDGYTFLESIVQPIHILHFKGSDVFRYAYEQGGDVSDVIINGEAYAFVKSITINEAVWDEFKLQVSSGRKFTQQDYVWSDDILPVILGSEYKSFYHEGDTLEINHYTRHFTTKVIGFLDENSAIVRRGKLLFLDRYVILPSVVAPNEPENEEDQTFQGISYVERLNGSVILHDGIGLNHFIVNLTNLRRVYDIYDFSILETAKWEIDMLNLTKDESLRIILLLSLVMITFSIISLSVLLTAKLRNNRQVYAVHLMSGATNKHIQLFVIIEALFIYILAHTFAVLLTIILFGRIIAYSPSWLVLSLFTVFFACIQPIYYISRVGISETLRRKD